jgi:hypothetical protein
MVAGGRRAGADNASKRDQVTGIIAGQLGIIGK